MPFLSRLFGKSAASAPPKAAPVLHKDCRIFAQPIKEGGTYRVAARIEKAFDGQVKIHDLIRADTCTTVEEATAISLTKATQAIDQLGNALFD